MIYKIFFTLVNGETDSIVIEGEAIEEIQKKAKSEVEKRGAVDAWSERIQQTIQPDPESLD